MRPGLFICGCDPQSERIKSYRATIIPGTDILSTKAYDHEGFEICPIHSKRLYGWGTTHKNKPHPNSAMKMKGAVTIRSTMPNLRDNRDPVAIGLAVLAKGNGGPKVTYHEAGSYGDIAP